MRVKFIHEDVQVYVVPLDDQFIMACKPEHVCQTKVVDVVSLNIVCACGSRDFREPVRSVQCLNLCSLLV